MKKSTLKYTLLFFLSIIVISKFSWSQDKYVLNKTDQTEISVIPIMHSSMVLNIAEVIVFTDPYGGPDKYKDLEKPDIILITDIHPDHYNVETLEKVVAEKTDLIAPKAVYDMMPPTWQRKTQILNNGETVEKKGISFTAVPMYNNGEKAKKFHAPGRGNGYVVNHQGYRIYLSGDTERTKEMKGMKKIDVAFICMNQPYTMTPEQAATAVKGFKPKKVIPFHYRNGDGSFSNVESFEQMLNGTEIEVISLNWYPQ